MMRGEFFVIIWIEKVNIPAFILLLQPTERQPRRIAEFHILSAREHEEILREIEKEQRDLRIMRQDTISSIRQQIKDLLLMKHSVKSTHENVRNLNKDQQDFYCGIRGFDRDMRTGLRK